MVANNVDFSTGQLLNDKKLQTEIIPKYPQHKKQIIAFSRNLRNSVFLVVILFFLIVIGGFLLKNK